MIGDQNAVWWQVRSLVNELQSRSGKSCVFIAYNFLWPVQDVDGGGGETGKKMSGCKKLSLYAHPLTKKENPYQS